MAAAVARTVPGVYFEPRPRQVEQPVARTDVVGFVGFEARVRASTHEPRLTGGPPAYGHNFSVDVAGFDLTVGDARLAVPETDGFALSSDTASVPVADGEGIVYALLAVAKGSALRLMAAAGSRAVTGSERPPDDADATAAARKALGLQPTDLDPPWVRIADVRASRRGEVVWLTVMPRLPPARCDDWNDFVQAFGVPRAYDGTFLGSAVRAFFANGGGRCHVATVCRPEPDDARALAEALGEFVGVRGTGLREATGLERLILIDEVAVVDVPDLYARRAAVEVRTRALPGATEDARFRPCRELVMAPAEAEARGEVVVGEPLYSDAEVRREQIEMLRRCIDERWRLFLLLTVPLEFDPGEARYRERSLDELHAWRQALVGLGEDPEKMACVALYFPWVLAQERVDGPVLEMPPTPFAAGVIARRDLARGPHVAPANETLRGAVALSQPINDELHGALYETPGSINVLRPFPGFGIQVWGARTLSSDLWLRHIPVQRCVSAIARRVVHRAQALVFEPHQPLLWLQFSQLVLGVLLSLFEAGVLRGSRPEEAFYIRCDSSVNPPEQVERGVLVCEIGVAVAAPAEFIVFRVGRREGVVEVIE